MLLAALLALHDPVASFTAAPTSGAPPLSVTVDASASTAAHGAIVSYTWDWGDGSPPGSGVTAVHVYASTGTYVIRLRVVDESGLDGEATRSIDCLSAGNTRPSASLTATPSRGAAPFSPALSGVGTDPGDVLEHRWDFGDGSAPAVFAGLASGAASTPAHVYRSPGTYTCVLRVADAEGVIASASLQIVVSRARSPVADFSVTPGRAAPAALFQTDASASFDPGGGALTYTWHWGDGTTSTGGPANSHAYAATGTYSIRLVVEDSDALTAETTREVHCASPSNVVPSAHLQGVLPESGVAPLSVTFVGHGHDDGGSLTHIWDFGDGTAPMTIAGMSNHENSRPEHTYLHPGSYVATLRVVDGENVVATKTTSLTVLDADGPLGDRCGATGAELLLLGALAWLRRRRLSKGPLVALALAAAAGAAEAQVTCTGCAERVLPANTAEAGKTSARLAVTLTGGDRAFSGRREALAPPPPADIEWSRALVALDVYHQFTPKIGAGVVLPWYEQTVEYRATGAESDAAGLGDVGLYAFWSPWREAGEPAEFFSAANLSFMLAMSVPTGDELDGEVPALHNYHLGSGSVEFKFLGRYDGRISDVWSLYGAAATTIDGGPDTSGFRYGNGYDLQIGGLARPWPELRILAAVDVIRREEDRLSGVEVPDSGGTWIFGLLGAAWAPRPDLIVELTAAIPIRRDVNGTQPVSEEVWSAGLTLRF